MRYLLKKEQREKARPVAQNPTSSSAVVAPSRTRTFQPHPRRYEALVGMATVLFALVTSFSPPLSLRTAVPSPSTCVRTADVQMINLFGNNGARNTPFREFLF